ncbi:hypothetical protein G6F46_002882 [Rhizopus delemar]|nr:hypothetical protein G6F55_007394 [Rhizopus delemar]KAG1540093.1 hypothetical protein G6F51_008734 [Rhizopus arrhizus]KAG1493871.1 hypothetical protein G6F54_008279 [Rhizopus delemar]KAG1507985.1 hypothetical protein G6F53_008532 [Rhizopus delemar]KAG1528519.1 hypothetical protein G6F52_000574 [Rhizopus delemar]
MINKITRACDIHKQRNLPFCSRATVFNTLILSTLWHILRGSWVSQRTLGSIHRICREFMFRIFPPVSFDIPCLPFTKGGLGILDPYVQQWGLQFRWLTPLLQHTTPPKVVFQWIAAHTASASPVVLLDPRLPFLFLPVRCGLLHSSKPSICSTLFKAFDALLDTSAVSMALKTTFSQPDPVPIHFCLTLPLSAVISWSSAVSIAEQRTFDSLLIHSWSTNVMLHQERDFIFQEDGASCHIGGYSRRWKETHQIKGFEYWPAQSPYLNPIERVWNALEKRIKRKRSSVKNLEQLKVVLRGKWERMDDVFTDRLVRSMKRRCEAVIKTKGCATEY